MLMRKIGLSILTFLWASQVAAAPNVILVMADDMGIVRRPPGISGR